MPAPAVHGPAPGCIPRSATAGARPLTGCHIGWKPEGMRVL